jgi:hypothetical protein
MRNKNVQKQKASPKRSITEPGEDHPLGLWIDKDLLRKHHDHRAKPIPQDPFTSSNNRYLELADLALGVNKPNGKPNGKPKAKSKSTAAE